MELIGQRFGHIRVTEVVGQGGMGDVYAGYDEKLERKVALKVLNADQRLDRDARERLLREARALSKIEHPNICRIHDYIESGDVDLLVLEYIDGRTLSDVMAERIARGEKLRIATAVAGVLVAAHRAGIVHRDLKPENVMLTRDGEVKVLDFGLARWLNRPRRSSDRNVAAAAQVVPFLGVRGDTLALESDYDSAAPVATAVGITLGTPLYMSPEQARGDVLTPASDMFSFGLLLQALFTGEDPHPMGLTAREVILRAARGETNPVQNTPGDIAALIGRLKQFAPADRPTAMEALARLRFLAEKPQRIFRRAIAAALILIASLGIWRYLVDLRRERAIAVAAEAEAKRQRAHAEDLIEFMLGDLRKKLGEVGRLDILDEVGKRALAYAESLHPETMSAEELARNAKALNQLGEVRIAEGKLNEALRVFQHSVALTERAVQREPASPSAQLALATSHFWVGDVYRLQSKLSEALRHYKVYLATAEQLAKTYPANDDFQLERAYGYSVVASIYERQGEFTRALDHLSVTRDVKSARLLAKPSDPDREADLARTLNRMGFVYECSGDLDQARQHYELEFASYSRLSVADPPNARWKDRLITSHSYIASLLEMSGNLDDALEHWQQMRALASELHTRDPQNAQWHRNLAIAQMRHGNALRLKGEPRSALQLIRDANQTLEPLLERDPTQWSWRRDMAVIHTAAARALLASNDASAARRESQQALDLLGRLTTADPSTTRYVADAYLVLGETWAAEGDRPRATEAWSNALERLTPLARDMQTPPVLDAFARALIRVGRRIEASPIIDRLNLSGYRAPDFVSATLQKR